MLLSLTLAVILLLSTGVALAQQQYTTANAPSCQGLGYSSSLAHSMVGGNQTAINGNLVILITADSAAKEFSFTSNIPIGAVLVAGSNNGVYLFAYNEPSSYEGGLIAPAGSTITQATFCYSVSPTIVSNQPDYEPGSHVILTGANWQPSETVHIFVNDESTDSWSHNADVTAASDGGIHYDFDLPPWFIAGLSVTATGEQSGVATSTFTDLSIGTYDQCSNDDGDGYPPADTGCRWINGNLNANNSVYFESDSTVQRVWLTDFQPGSTHTVTLKYGTTKAGKHAYDFLTTFDASEDWVTLDDRCQDVTGCTTANETVLDIPQDPNVPNGFEPSAPGDRQFVMRGGTLDGATTPVIVSGSYAGDSETVITVTFTVASSGSMCETKGQNTTCSVALWFGAHVADENDWGIGTGAASISGSPYHVALDAIDGVAVGQRDNQMQSDTIVVAPSLTVTKTPSVTDVCNGLSTQVTYTYVVTNTGNVSLTINLVDDHGTPGNSADDIDVDGGTGVLLAAGNSQTFTVPLTVNGTVTNTVTATGVSLSGVSAQATATATVNGHDCDIEVAKSPSQNQICAGLSTDITYTYTVTNPGDVALGNVTLSDDNGTPANNADNFAPTFVGGDTNGNNLLDTTETWTYTAVRNLSATTTNTVTASGSALGKNPADTDTATATVTAVDCDIEVAKSPSQNTICAGLSTEITYTYTVTNPGDVALGNVTLSDDNGTPGNNADNFAPSFVGGDTNGNNLLDTTETWTYTAVRNLSATTTNTVTASGSALGKNPADTDTATATVTAVDCDIEVAKSPSQNTICAGLSTEITYTYTVTNPGDVALGNVTLSDDNGTPGNNADNFAPTFVGGDTNGNSLLDTTETWTYTAQKSLSATTTNTVTASGSALGKNPADTDTATATVTAVDCDIEVAKSPSQNTVCVGQSTNITYTYTVTNPGDVALGNVTLSDDNGTPANNADNFAPSFVGGDTNGNSLLDTTETWTYTAARALSATTTNTVTASGSALGKNPADTDTATATVTAVPCAIDIVKTPSQNTICAGLSTEITYTYTVTNPGAVALSNVVLSDNNGTPGVPGDDFAPTFVGGDTNGNSLLDTTETWTYTAVRSLSATTTNTVTATATALGKSVTDTTTATVTAVACDIEVTKTPSQDRICQGLDTSITYTYSVTNPGGVELSNVVLSDDNGTPGNPADDFAPTFSGGDTDGDNKLDTNETWTYTAQKSLSATTTNTVTASGSALGKNPADTDTATATVTAVACDIEVTKTAGQERVCEGVNTNITYTYTVTNPGGVALGNVTLTDDNGTPGVPGDDFAPTFVGGDTNGNSLLDTTETWTYTKVKAVSATTTNTVTATGSALGKNPADTDTATATVTAVVCRITLVKTLNGGPLGPNDSFTFTLSKGGVLVATETATAADSTLFNTIPLSPGTYTICELEVPAGADTIWHVNGQPVIPTSDPTTGNTCVDVVIVVGSDITITVDNIPPPGGDARTPGYWKNWNTCTRPADWIARKKAQGFTILDDVLPQLIGDLLVDTCAEGVAVLDRRTVDGKKGGGDVAYGLASHLLAYRANQAAGAYQCAAAATAATQAQQLLDYLNFNGTGSYLTGGKAQTSVLRNYANQLLGILDAYNNNVLNCASAVPAPPSPPF